MMRDKIWIHKAKGKQQVKNLTDKIRHGGIYL